MRKYGGVAYRDPHTPEVERLYPCDRCHGRGTVACGTCHDTGYTDDGACACYVGQVKAELDRIDADKAAYEEPRYAAIHAQHEANIAAGLEPW